MNRAVGIQRIARRAAIVSLLSVLLVVPGAALDWPVANRILTGTFGEDRGDHFHNGIDIGGGDQVVRPALPGELVFRYDEGSDYSSLPRGVGSYVVLHHGQGIFTLYCHLANGTLGPVRTSYAASDQIGIIGESGDAQGKHLHFTVYDQEAGSAINPLSFLPARADKQAPVIRRILLVVGDRSWPLEPRAVLKPGRAEVLAEVYDLREDVSFSWPLAPYSISLSLDGTEVSRLTFDSIQVKDGKSVVGAGLLTRDDVYNASGLMRLGALDLRPGDAHLKVTARDVAGNETAKEIPFSVQE